jgi:tetratricopeptide (TPR) repeat protein
MDVKIFINYRRDDSIGMAGRLHDRLAQTFGRDNIFMDVDHIPVGAEFVTHINNQVAACNVLLVLIGPDWIRLKDKAGHRRLHKPDDFVAIEIAAALTRNIRVIPVLVDGARMPQESELPDTLKPLVRRQAAEARHAHFGTDADALIARMREALGDEGASTSPWRMHAAGAALAVAVLVVIGWAGYAIFHIAGGFDPALQTREVQSNEQQTKAAGEKANRDAVEAARQQAAKEEERKQAEAEAKRKADEAALQQAAKEEERKQAEAEAKRKADEAARQQAAKEEEERKQAEAEAKRKADEAARQQAAKEEEARKQMEAEARRKAVEAARRQAAKEKEEEARKQAEAEKQARYAALLSKGTGEMRIRDYDNAVRTFSEAIRLNSASPVAFNYRGYAYQLQGVLDRSFADLNNAIRLDPNYALAFSHRGGTFFKLRDFDRAIVDFNEAIQLDPRLASAFHGRGASYLEKGNIDRAIGDLNQAILIDPNVARVRRARGFAYLKKGDYRRAIADYDEAIRLDPGYAPAYCRRGSAKLRINDKSGNADLAKATQLDASACAGVRRPEVLDRSRRR